MSVAGFIQLRDADSTTVVTANAAGRTLSARSRPAPSADPPTSSPPAESQAAPTTVAERPTTQPTTTPAPTPAVETDPMERFIVTIHGDERVIDAERELRLALAPAAVEIDGEPGRSLLASATAIATEARRGLVDVVVLAIGAHDGANPAGYEDLVGGTLDALSEVGCVVWVTAEATSEGLVGVNEAIRRQAARFDHVVVAEWAEVAESQRDGALIAQADERFGLLVGGAVRQCVLDPG